MSGSDGDDELILVLFLQANRWKRSRTEPGTQIPDFVPAAQRAERAKFHAVFVAETLAYSAHRFSLSPPSLAPLGILHHLAAVTNDIGVIGTASTTWSEPYNLARAFATLDSLSDGRAGWNIVTSATGSTNFGAETPPDHKLRYERADEFVAVVDGLWASWHDGALEPTDTGSVRVNADKIHPINHRGEFFSVDGPLNTPPSPQRRPLYVQAGSSEDGVAFAAKHAELVFTAQPFAELALGFRDKLHAEYRRTGRSGLPPRIVMGVRPIIAASDQAAEAKFRRSVERLDLDGTRGRIEDVIGVSLASFDLDEQLPRDLVPEVDSQTWKGNQTFYEINRRYIAEGITLRQLLTTDLHWRVIGTPESVTERLLERYRSGATDGFNLIVNDEESFELFLSKVVPALQSEGVFRTEYAARTLRADIAAAGHRSTQWTAPQKSAISSR